MTRQTEASSPASSPAAENVEAFVPEGMETIDTVHGDLTGRGTADVLLVVSPAETSTAKLGEGSPRTVLLLTRDRFGRLQQQAGNSRIVPCARCGGIAGDPYGYAQIDAGTVTVAISGGSRERWFDDYIFRYSPERSTWQLIRVVRGVSDTHTGSQKQIELDNADFGEIAFAEFDPAALSAAVTLD